MISNAIDSEAGLPPDHQFREYYNALFRNLRLGSRDGQSSGDTQASHAIGISSAEGCSKSSVVASNLAICIANSAGERSVLLISADPANRVPGVTFSLRNHLGIYDVIHEGVSVDDVIKQTHVANLSAIGCGTRAEDSMSVSCLVRFRSVLQELKARYATVIVDLPVANELTPCFDMAGELDGIVLAVESQRVNRRTAQIALGKLRFVNADVLGCVFVDS